MSTNETNLIKNEFKAFTINNSKQNNSVLVFVCDLYAQIIKTDFLFENKSSRCDKYLNKSYLLDVTMFI